MATEEHSADCAQRAEEQRAALLRETELSSDNLSVFAAVASSIGVLSGLLSTLLFQNVSASVAQAELRWISLLLAVIVLSLFEAISLFVNSALFLSTYEHSPTWARLVLRVAQTTRTFATFLFFNFVNSLWIQSWTASHFNWLEALCGIWSITLSLPAVLFFLGGR